MSDTVVIGGGLAGGAAATLLARDGRKVLLLERESEPTDKVCGEFLSRGAQHMLGQLGIDLDRLGATSITTLRLTSGRRTITASLPFTARGMSRRRLDAVLLDQAAAAGAEIARGTIVREVRGGCVATSSGLLDPELLIIASGKHEVRGVARDTARHSASTVGFKMYWRLPAPARAALDRTIDVVLFDGGYSGLQLVEEDRANLSLIVERDRLAAIGGNWTHLLTKLLAMPQLERLLGSAEPLLPRPLAVARMPYGFLARASSQDGFFRIGDQAAVIPSFCGEGMAMALRSAFLASSVIAGGGHSDDHLHVMRNEFKRRMSLASTLQRAIQRRWVQYLVPGVLATFPRLIDWLAENTRVPSLSLPFEAITG